VGLKLLKVEQYLHFFYKYFIVMYIQSDLKELVDKALANMTADSEAQNLIGPVRYILSMGGKRLRPVMSLMACNLYSDKIDHAVIPSAGIEVFHNFTLVHDDIMDQAEIRRGLPVIHRKWNINQAILSGDVMAFIANDCFLHSPSHLLGPVFRVFNKAAIDVCIGQQLDMDFENMPLVKDQEYLEMIELKTAVLIAASFRIGAMLGGAGEKDAAMLYEFGRNLGIAFQIQDDILDVWGDPKVFGKKPGGDIVVGKKTFPFIKAVEKAPAKMLKELNELYASTTVTNEEKVSRVIAIFDELGIKEVTETIAYQYINNSFSILNALPVKDEKKEEIRNLSFSLIGRDY